MNLSLAGCGGMGVYHIGVVSCFKTYAPHVLLNKVGDGFGSQVLLYSSDFWLLFWVYGGCNDGCRMSFGSQHYFLTKP